jgi:hypothetical protein
MDDATIHALLDQEAKLSFPETGNRRLQRGSRSIRYPIPACRTRYQFLHIAP